MEKHRVSYNQINIDDQPSYRWTQADIEDANRRLGDFAEELATLMGKHGIRSLRDGTITLSPEGKVSILDHRIFLIQRNPLHGSLYSGVDIGGYIGNIIAAIEESKSPFSQQRCSVTKEACDCKPGEGCEPLKADAEDQDDEEQEDIITVTDDGYTVTYRGQEIYLAEVAEIAYDLGQPTVTVKLSAAKVVLE